VENQESFDEIYLALAQLANRKRSIEKRNPVGFTLQTK
jgi:hypothetical protein